MWIRPPGKRKAKFKHTIIKGIFSGFFSCTHRNILLNNHDTGRIGPVNHGCCDEGMNDLPFKLIPPNEHDLEQSEQDNNFSAEPTEVDTQDELLFIV